MGRAVSAFDWFATGLLCGMLIGACLVLVAASIIAEWYWRRDDAEWASREREPAPARGQVIP
jgi:hypothetical protein